MDFFTLPLAAYHDSAVAQFAVTDLAPGPYPLKVDFYNTLGPTEDIFVNGDGTISDKQIHFGTALVNYRPTVSLTEPLEGALFTLPVTISLKADAKDLDGQVAKVEFFDGTEKIGETTSGPFSFAWVNPAPGPHTIKAVATDDLGATATSTSTTINVKKPNAPPQLAAIGNKSVDENVLLTIKTTATDTDLPEQTLTFSLDAGAPPSAAIDPITGIFTWQPTEAQGPGSYPITIRVTDNGSPPLSASETISINVSEINSPPVLTVPPDQVINELTTLNVTSTATDPDIPANALTFSLVSAPSGADLNPTTGVLTWTPTEAQGPSANVITVSVTDNGVPPLSDTKSFTVVVKEVNTAPALAAITDKTVTEGDTLAFTATATDADLPAQKLTFSLDAGAPTGAGMDPTSGAFKWTPTAAQTPSTNKVTIRVTDNGDPALSDTKTITIITAARYAVFAGETNKPVGSKVIDWGGNSNVVSARIHSNSDIDVSGNKHVFSNGAVEYVTGINPAPDFKGKVTLTNSTLVSSTVLPYPVDYRLSQFAPGGASAIAAQQAGKYYQIKGDTDLKDFIARKAPNGKSDGASDNGCDADNVLKEGLYYVEGKIHLSGSSLCGTVTLVATDEIQISGSGIALQSFTRCLLAFTEKSVPKFDQTVIKISAEASQWQGAVYAPSGGIEMSGAGNPTILGGVIGRSIKVTGSDYQITGIDLSACTTVPGSVGAGSLATAAEAPMLIWTPALSGTSSDFSFPRESAELMCWSPPSRLTYPTGGNKGP